PEIEPGMMTWDNEAVRFARGITQDVRMPRYSRAEPLVGETSHYAFRCDPMVALGTAFPDVRLAATTGGRHAVWTRARFCLGIGAYAPESSTGTGIGVPLSLLPTDIN